MNDRQLSDLEERKLALCPNGSFVVQAPAGSGKTSLLVQRYLKLLAIVNAPEEILAITFTRKAACEMRSRIITALKKAETNSPAQNRFEATTHELAIAALKQDQIKKWRILQNPNRLRLQTIDALCNYLVKRTPILTQIDLNSTVIQNQEADSYYSKAAQAVLKNITDPEYTPHLERLLLHLDNDWQRAESLFVTMLKSREQWLPHITGAKNTQQLRQKMESSLQEIAQESIELCLALFPIDLYQELIPLLKFSQTNKEQPKYSYLSQDSESEKNSLTTNLTDWQTIADLLLTKESSWRKKITIEQGFPAPSSPNLSRTDKALFKAMKAGMEELLLKFSSHENLRLNLENLRLSPKPNYQNQQWELIETLLELLPLLAAQLKLIFSANSVTDHAEIAMAASRALGDQEIPSDLALNLDYRLQHLLIDEFQDTSISQYRLIEKLITTWQPDDGRTIFLVGDPMQSIYRFREAEVGLFLRTQHEGIGGIKLQPLTLTANFRSTQSIISWINENFPQILPTIADISYGAVPFKPSVAVANLPNSGVTINLLQDANDDAEAAHVVAVIQEIIARTPNDTSAILVKSRKHLTKILLALRHANLNYQAVELETFHTSMLIRDLFSLTRALYDLTDRIAWIAILRAPWCGLDLSDLHKIANGKEQLIWDNICAHTTLNLSDDGKTRLRKFSSALTPFFSQRERLPWHELVEKSWLAIGGPATANHEEELTYAEIYLELLTNNQFDLPLLQKKLESLYIPTTSLNAKIQIMTIHKAKGLEFDHVLIPGINRPTRTDERKLLLWLERPKLHQGSSLLLAPIEASGDNTDHVYRYLRRVEQQKSGYETGRLLYVAMTRAKKSLYLTGCIKNGAETCITNNIQTGSLLEQLKSCFDKAWVTTALPHPNFTSAMNATNIQSPVILRLKPEWRLPISIPVAERHVSNMHNWQLPDNQIAIIGTIIHHLLRQISEGNLNAWTNNRLINQYPYWRKLLQQSGYIDLAAGLKLITTAITTTLADERGRWILTKHQDAMSELAITAKVNHKIINYIIDRTFIDANGVRWIIDYKNSQPNNQTLAEFLLQERGKYAPQLLQYAAAMRMLDPTRTIKLGLYFPLCSGWITVLATSL